MKYDYRMEEQLLRLLYVEGGAWSKREMALKLGLTEAYFEKFFDRIRDQLIEISPEQWVTKTRKKFQFSRLRHSGSIMSDLSLLWFYRNQKSLKSAEMKRLVRIILFLMTKPMTLNELLESFVDHPDGFEDDSDFIDRRSMERYLKTLVDEGMIQRIKIKKQNHFSVDTSLYDFFEFHEIEEIQYWIQFYTNEALVSAPGFMLLDKLRFFIMQKNHGTIESFEHKGVYYHQLLDEYKIDQILETMLTKQCIKYRYFPKMSTIQSLSKKNLEINEQIIVKPLTILFEHTYGRWYLIGINENGHQITHKLQGMTDMDVVESCKINNIDVDSIREGILSRLNTAWLVAEHGKCEVELRFFVDLSNHKLEENSCWQRVLQECPNYEVVDVNEQFIGIKIRVNGIREIKPWIRSFGSVVEVLQPQRLRDELIHELDSILKLYTD